MILFSIRKQLLTLRCFRIVPFVAICPLVQYEDQYCEHLFILFYSRSFDFLGVRLNKSGKIFGLLISHAKSSGIDNVQHVESVFISLRRIEMLHH